MTATDTRIKEQANSAAATRPGAGRGGAGPSSSPDSRGRGHDRAVDSAPHKPETAPAPAPAPAAVGHGRGLDEAPLRTKVALLVASAAVAGAGLGMLAAHSPHPLIVLGPGLAVLCVSLAGLGRWWIAGPVDRLARRLELLGRTRRRVKLKDLPVHRRDEVGRIARAMHTVTGEAIRHRADAHQLRRTLDHRVESQTRRATAKLQRMVMRDPMTGLGNRRFLDQQLGPLTRAAAESGTELLCVMMDLDNFKTVNDTLGHAAGDALLAMLAQVLRGAARHEDLAVRLGGDEFALLMPGADAHRAREMVDHLRRLFTQQARSLHPGGPHAGLSAGLAMLHGDRCATGQDLLQRADHALYDAKAAGKNRTKSEG